MSLRQSPMPARKTPLRRRGGLGRAVSSPRGSEDPGLAGRVAEPEGQVRALAELDHRVSGLSDLLTGVFLQAGIEPPARGRHLRAVPADGKSVS